MDFMTSIPKVAGNNAIMDIVCRLNKWSAFMSYSKLATAEEVVQLFLDNWVRHRTFSCDIMSDRELFLQTQFWQHMMRRTWVRSSIITVWPPQGGGLTEMINSIINMYIKVFCENDQQDWPTFIYLVKLYYNTTISRSTGKTSFYLCYKKEVVNTRIKSLTSMSVLLLLHLIHLDSSHISGIVHLLSAQYWAYINLTLNFYNSIIHYIFFQNSSKNYHQISCMFCIRASETA